MSTFKYYFNINEKVEKRNINNEKKIKDFYNMVMKQFLSKNSKMKMKSTIYGVHLYFDHTDLNKTYTHFISYDSINNEFFKESNIDKIIVAEINTRLGK